MWVGQTLAWTFEVARGLSPYIGKNFLNKKYKGLENISTDFLKGQKGIAAACFGVADCHQEVVIATIFRGG